MFGKRFGKDKVMDSVEILINDLNNKIAKLERDLEQAEQDILDFEGIARTWKEGYEEEVSKLRIKIKEQELIIEELENEITSLGKNYGRN